MSFRRDIWVSPYNFIEDVTGEFKLPSRIGIYDCTLRDGEQVPGLVFRKTDKIRIAQALDELGVQRIEAGMPIVSAEDKEVVKELVDLRLNAEIWGFCRCVIGDIDACLEVDVESVICEIATSPFKMKAYSLTEEIVLERIVEAITYAKEHGLRVAFFAVDMTRADINFLRKAYITAVNEAHADEVVAVDTLGVALPETIFYLTKKLKEWVKVPIHIHCHNEFGMATACSIAAVKAGAEWIHVSVNGIGERSGNTDIAEVSLALLLLYGRDVGIKYEKLRKTSKLVEELSGIKMPPNKPVVGDAIFKRESGVTVLQLINYPPSVEPYPPELVGGEREIIIGKKSGKHSIEWKLKKLGINATDKQILQILNMVKEKSIEKRKHISDEDFISIVNQVLKSNYSNKPTISS